MATQTNVLIAASECAPLIKVGGIADVVGSLPPALKNKHTTVSVILPYYQSLQATTPIRLVKKNITVTAAHTTETISLHHTTDEHGADIYLIKNTTYLSNGGVYGSGNPDAESDEEMKRFYFFSLCIPAILDHLPVQPTVLHLNDWHTGCVPLLLKNSPHHNLPTVLTIHNIGYQGSWDINRATAFLGIPKSLITSTETDGASFNALKSGVYHSDAITTVSPTYAKEIMTKEFGYGIDPLLRTRKKDVYGILNGIDLQRFNPATDKQIHTTYTTKTLHKKQLNKQALQTELGLAAQQDTFLVGMIGRLAYQKGVELITDIIPSLARNKIQIVILGTGDPQLEQALTRAQQQYPDYCCAKILFDGKLAQRMYAGCDALLIPSRYEPCGLTQMIAMRYGTIPIVRNTGGLADTVTGFRANNRHATGFVFHKLSAYALSRAVHKAHTIFSNQPTVWNRLQTRGMNSDFSWNNSAQQYQTIYQSVINAKH